MSDENESTDKPVTPPALPNGDKNTTPDKMAFEPLDKKSSFGNVVDALLKTPGRLFYEMQEGEAKNIVVNLAFIAMGSLALFAGVTNRGYITVWAAIFIVVTLQLSTSLRPLVGPAEFSLLPKEKRFFLEHWVKSLEMEDNRYD